MAIACELYDTIEIVCMYRYSVTLLLKNGDKMSGVAMDTVRDEMKQECIALENDGVRSLVVLEALKEMRVNVNNPHFSVVCFN